MTDQSIDPALVTYADIEAAAVRISGAVRRTPVVATTLGRPGCELFCKAESLQLGGAFKLRGAVNAIAQLSPAQRTRGVVTHSSGNHGQALARAARDAGVAATIVMPRQAPAVKKAATEALGATVVLVDISERESAVEELQRRTGAVFVPPYDDRAIIAGQGTVGLEILADLPDVATVLVPVSGGGLISGIAVAVKAKAPQVRIVAVEPELAGDLAEGFSRGARMTWTTDRTGRTIADGLRTTSVGELNWRHITGLVDDVVLVSEDAIRAAMRAVVLDAKLVCEPSGAVAVAGYLEHPSTVGQGPAVAVVSGGNVAPELLGLGHQRGTAGGRRMKLFAIYTASRLALFLVCYGLIWAVLGWFVEFDQLTALSTALVALVVSSVIAFRVLAGMRDRFAAHVAQRAERARVAYDSRRRREDADE